MSITLRRILSSFGLVLTGLAFIMFATSTHVSAASMPTHNMSGMNQTSSKPAGCASLCMSAPAEEQQKSKDGADEQDDQPQPLITDTAKSLGIADKTNVPDNSLSWRLLKVPLYVLYEVYRN